MAEEKKQTSFVGLLFEAGVAVSTEDLTRLQAILSSYCAEFLSGFYALSRIAAVWLPDQEGAGYHLKLEVYLEAVSSEAFFARQYWAIANIVWDKEARKIRGTVAGSMSNDAIRFANEFSVNTEKAAENFDLGLRALLRTAVEIADSFAGSADGKPEPRFDPKVWGQAFEPPKDRPN